MNSVITALTGIKTICSICSISHQPLLMSLQQEVKSIKMFIPLCPMQMKYLKTFYIEHAKKPWSGDNWDKHSELIPAPVAQIVFRLADCMDWKDWIFAAEHLALKAWPQLLCAFLRFSHWITSSLLPWLQCLLVMGAHLLIKFHPRGIHFVCFRIDLWCEPKHQILISQASKLKMLRMSYGGNKCFINLLVVKHVSPKLFLTQGTTKMHSNWIGLGIV